MNWGYTGIGYNNSRTDRLLRVQLILYNLADLAGGMAGDCDIEFSYAIINWETGDASEGIGGLWCLCHLLGRGTPQR